jgi:hypothetical protein
MNQEILVSIKLTTVMEQDKRTGFFTAYYKQFPQAIAYGKTETEAELSLIDICQIMFNERKGEIKQELIENYIPKADLESFKINVNKATA